MAVSELSYSTMRSDALAMEMAEKRVQQRKRSLLVLVYHYLRQESYVAAADALLAESPPSLTQHQPCDNVDLDIVVQDYEAYYQMRYQRAPKLIRRMAEAGSGEPESAPPRRQRPRPRPKPNGGPGSSGPGRGDEAASPASPATPLVLRGRECGRSATSQEEADPQPDGVLRRRTLQLSPPASPELQAMAALVSRDLYLDDPGMHWCDIVGLESAKRVVREAVVYPLRYPALFSGGLATPWRALLLFGPPGNGKTLLAKAVATECRTTFFNVSAATLVSKWHGDSEKLVRVLFELARQHAPSTIFLDELDALLGRRGASSEHEASRRLKTELLLQLDGVSRCREPVFVLAASNLPWELDAALLRRLEKRVLVPLPTAEERAAVFRHYLRGWPLHQETEASLPRLAQITDGYSAADIQLVCREAAMDSLRAVLRRLETTEDAGEPARPAPLSAEDLEEAVQRCRPAGGQLSQRYSDWSRQFGAE